MDFDARPRMITTVLLHFEHIPLQRLQGIIRETKKTFCFLDPMHVSKVESIYRFAAPFIKKIVNKCFGESTFVLSEKRSLIHRSIKGWGLDQDNMTNYRSVSNLIFLSKVTDWAMLDQLWKVLKEMIIPVDQSAYQKLHSPETNLCQIYVQ